MTATKAKPASLPAPEVLWSLYLQVGSVHKFRESHGWSHSRVHEALVKAGYKLRGAKFTAQDDAAIVSYYKDTRPENFDLRMLAKLLKRPAHTNVCRRAKQLGLTDRHRAVNAEVAKKFGPARKLWHQHNEHPRGMLGKCHTDAVKRAIGAALGERWALVTEDQLCERTLKSQKTRVAKGTSVQERPYASWKAGWREIGGVRKYYRSKWEANYAYYLQWLKEKGQISDWKHEPKTFWFEGIKRGCLSYLPDFWVQEVNGSEAYHEVKGWMDDRSVTKIRRMAKYHPSVKLIVVDSKAYKALMRSVKGLVPGWEE